jgi:serine/threonine protein kinase
MSNAVTAAEQLALVPGTTVGPWLIQQLAGAGSYGVVFRAQRAGDPEAPPVALKVARLPRDARFEREGELLRRHHHPAIPRFEDAGLWTSPSGHVYPYLVMEWVQGLTLYDWMRESARNSRGVLRVLEQVAGALAVAHAGGAVHRDVKGGNIRVQVNGRAVLLDWGSAWFSGAYPLTDTTVPPGTTAYRPPEQRAFMWHFRRDSEARWRSTPADDLYALGVTLYRAVTGVYPPPCTDGGEPVPRKVLRPSGLVVVCPALEDVTMRLLSDDRAVRGSAEQLAREAAVLVQTAVPEADQTIVPIRNALPTEEGAPFSEEAGSDREEPSGTGTASSTSESRDGSNSSASSLRRRRQRRQRRRHSMGASAWFSWASAGAVGGVVVAAALEFRGPRPPEPPESPEPMPWSMSEEWHAPEVDIPDAGVGEKALLSAAQAPRPVSPTYGVSLPMPKAPQPGQKKPPCDGAEVAALGACWVVLKKEPPCGTYGYDYAGLCVRASFEAPREPTSGEP